MIRVERHSRGLCIRLDSISAKNLLAKSLESAIGGQFLSYRDSLIVPARAAADLLNLDDLRTATWDAEVFAEAQRQARHRDQQALARFEVAKALEDPYATLKGYIRAAKLDRHQVEAVAAICTPSLRGLALFDEQGTGKTITALLSFDRLREVGLVKRLLVVAPKSVLGAWRAECMRFLPGTERIAMVSGPSSIRRRTLMAPHDILLVSYDSAVADWGLLKMIVAARPNHYMLVVDESYFVKNAQTLRAKALADIRPFCERAIVLCGTPAPNSARDVINQVNIADDGVTFGGRFISPDPKVAEREIEDALGETIFLRRLKEDVLPDIPKKGIERVLLDLRPRQRELYVEARDKLVVAVRTVDDREFTRHLASFLAKRAALLQLCSHPGAIDPLYDEIPAKQLALDCLLNELIDRDGKKVVVWSYFRHSLQALANRYTKYGVARIDGSVGDIEERIEAIRRFQNDQNTRLFVGNAAAAGAGITLTAAHHAIYESFSNQAAHYMQSVDRIHRRGQEHDVTYHVLLMQGTIEDKEFGRILEKERRGKDLLGDTYEEPITRERFLAELEATNP